jgi:hypothetical protein
MRPLTSSLLKAGRTMEWFVLLTFANGTSEKMYCTSRAEARERRAYYLRTMADLQAATVRRVTEG